MARRRGGGGRSRLPRYLGTAEVAGLLGVTTGRVRQLALAGELVEALRVGGRRLYRATTVQRFQRAWATPRRASE